MEALKATWIAGDFEQIAKSYRLGAADFVNRLEIEPGERVLDVACRTGNLTLPAVQKGARVTGVDIAPNLVQKPKAEITSLSWLNNDRVGCVLFWG